uniref:Protein yippee-like n=1 Tax=Kalanchoe fedtschenkoi TaxID=63787 RepID=A0A7N0SXW8_KALFE
MGRIFVVELEGRAYKCKFCDTHLALADDLVSRAFHCHRGKAFLFNNAVNVTVGEKEERLMLSGMHTVADVFCCSCGQIVGWKYEVAHERSQKYKEGKFVLESHLVRRGRIVDSIESEFFIDTQTGCSDSEDAQV